MPDLAASEPAAEPSPSSSLVDDEDDGDQGGSGKVRKKAVLNHTRDMPKVNQHGSGAGSH